MNTGLLQPVCGIVLMGLFNVLLLSGCEQPTRSPQPQLTVEIYKVGQGIVKRERTFHGRVVPADLTRVSFRVRGKIDHLAVQAGQRVSKGQVLAQIGDSIQSQVLAYARAQYQLSRRQLDRAEDLYKLDALTSAQRDQLQASFRLAEAKLKLAQAGLSYTLVKAPFDGTVADVSKELYEAVAAGETVITVYRNDRTDVLVSIPDVLPAKIHQAKNIKKLQVRAIFSDNQDTYTMRYLKSSTARNPKTQAFQFWVTMPTPKTPLPPGLPVTITTDLQEAGFSTESGLILPLTALEAAAQKDVFQVWRYEDGIVNPQIVEVGRITQRGALISGGLQSGDLIVTSGLSRLSAGQTVDIQFQDQGQNSP